MTDTETVLDWIETIDLDILAQLLIEQGWSYVGGCIYRRHGTTGWLQFCGTHYEMLEHR
jgi:hypothetical protein